MTWFVEELGEIIDAIRMVKMEEKIDVLLGRLQYMVDELSMLDPIDEPDDAEMEYESVVMDVLRLARELEESI